MLGVGHPVLQLDELALQAEELLEIGQALGLRGFILRPIEALQRLINAAVLDLHLQLFVVAVEQVAADAVGEAKVVHAGMLKAGDGLVDRSARGWPLYISTLRPEVAGLEAAAVDHHLVQHDAGLQHPELEHMRAGAADLVTRLEGGRRVGDIALHSRLPSPTPLAACMLTICSGPSSMETAKRRPLAASWAGT